jgi:hypothetical protein
VEFSNSDKRCIQTQQWAVKHARQLRYYFGLTIAPKYIDSKGRRQHTPVDVCGKLLKKIGLQSVVVRSQGKRGEQERVYSVAVDRVKADLQDVAWEYRDKALAAARKRLDLVVSSGTTSPLETQPESTETLQSEQNPNTQSEPGFDPAYSQNFRR